MALQKIEMITVLGPTAVGKTAVAVHLADRLGAEIISGDSRQLYRGMDIGTGKDLADYTINGHTIPYHLIDIVNAGYKYNVFEYQRDFHYAFSDIRSRGKMPILCGGAGMYIDAVVNGYQLQEVTPNAELREKLEQKTDEELVQLLASLKSLHNTTDIDTRKRTIRAIEIALYYQQNPQKAAEYSPIKTCYIGITANVEERRKRITQRLHQRLQEGMIEEVRSLMQRGLSAENLCYYGLEYKFITLYLTNRLSYDKMVNKLNIAIHQFAKRQMTWFRGMERKGAFIHWIDGMLSMDEKIEQIIAVLKTYVF
ncbi:MAG: tRNA (adenosine(37)-N6)-dimethylallyltransferase MiaA [Prevotellaceae bacterium]|jgi:tRNA dimethylallyltransferase|nr:tRNA (adenosine(37)-N6)-dimethylallyltransferase MiaA [Prevotellaceae bacterium]